jgi:CHAD domain-containing protein
LKETLASHEVPPEARGGVDALRDVHAARRGVGRKALRAALAAPRLLSVPERLAELATASLERPGPAFAVAGACRLPEAIEEALARRARMGRALAEAPGEALHAWRIAVKRARYAAEAFSPAFGRPVSRFVEATRELQDLLGTIQDARATREALHGLLADVPKADPRADAAVLAAGAITEAHERRAVKARRRLNDLADSALGTRELRELFEHLAKRAARIARGA